MDYKEILGNKAYHLRMLLYTYKDKLTLEEFNSIKVLVENCLLSVDGRLDSLDYDVRDKAIMDWHDKLDNAINSLENRYSEKKEKRVSQEEK